ncbi:hypothetical protein AGLY_018342 [Aphis glycines]|uniref:Regulatory protein zeste n=1 Tax=Aphis glycines TaxID=307491 RepID=A0A6G0SS85_APHGL|nr:hypothetical protein AGLY_018342 [Aphis glycines]
MSKRRSKNVNDAEKHMLLKLIKPQLSVVENIKTDGATNKMKCSVWENITTSYNALKTTGPRTSSQLKALFDVMKRKTKKDKSSKKINSNIHQATEQTEREKEVMLDLISENKLSVDSLACSTNAWDTIAETYNQLQTSGVKISSELKMMNQRDTYKTEGGQSMIHPSTISNKIIDMMGNRFESIESPYDCDGDFPNSYLGPNDINSIVEESTLQPKSLRFDDVVDNQHTEYENITSDKQLMQDPLKNSTSQEKFPKVSTRVLPKKVYENLNELTNQRLGAYSKKESFINDNNALKRKQSEIKLEILEIEKIVANEKLKPERENYASQVKQTKLKEDILEYELKKKLKEL